MISTICPRPMTLINMGLVQATRGSLAGLWIGACGMGWAPLLRRSQVLGTIPKLKDRSPAKDRRKKVMAAGLGWTPRIKQADAGLSCHEDDARRGVVHRPIHFLA